jgi:hypothetical protein
LAGSDIVGVPEGDVEVDEMRLDAVMSNAWPVRSIVSRREEGKRPKERRRRFASVDDACVDSLRKWTDKVHQRERQDERER